ncbi:MAG: sugar ABC transporter permease [Spirochaetes bacterium]|nr:sugar ABC transporter permease [Spirochaetota bacterium]
MSDSQKKGYLPFLIPGIIFFLIIIAVPFAMNVFISFTKWTGVGTPDFIGFGNYIKILSDTVFWISFRNNIIMILAVTVIPTILGLIFAVILFDHISAYFGLKTVNLIRSGIYLPQIMPIAIAGVVWGWILNPGFGVLNWILEAVNLGNLAHNWLGDAKTALPTIMFIMVWFQIGYPLVIFMSAMQRIDPELMEAASLDGAGWLERLKITIYMIRPEIMVVVLTTTIASLKLFAQIFVLTRGGPGNATLVPSYFAYQNFFEKARVGYGATISTIMTIIIVILTIIFIKTQLKFEKEESA